MPKKNFLNSLTQVAASNNVADTTTSRRLLGQQARQELEKNTEDAPIQEIEIRHLHDNPYQILARPELKEDGIGELVESLRRNGFYGALLARPRRGQAGEYEIAYGHRRKEAARRAGLVTLPVKVLNLNDEEMARVMASENFSREDLTPIGEANVVGHLYTTQNLSMKEIASSIGQSEKWVRLRLALYEAPADVKKMVEQKPDTLSHATILAKVKETNRRAELIEQILAGQLTREGLEASLNPNLKNTVSRDAIVKNVTEVSPGRSSDKIHNQELVDNKVEIVKNTTKTPQGHSGEEIHNPNGGNQIKPKLDKETVSYQYKLALNQLKAALNQLETLSLSRQTTLANQARLDLPELAERLQTLISGLERGQK